MRDTHSRDAVTRAVLAGAVALGVAVAGAEVMTDGTGNNMELRITAGGEAAISGSFEMVTVSSGPVSPGGSDGTGYEAFPLSAETFALPAVLSQFSLE